jgi:hypothetical protein
VLCIDKEQLGWEEGKEEIEVEKKGKKRDW